MLITELKSREALAPLVEGKKVFIINCEGCKEVHFPGKEAAEFQKELISAGCVTGTITTDYICNHLPHHSLFQEPGERPVRRFQERHV